MANMSIWSKFLDTLFPRYCVHCARYQDTTDLYPFLCPECFLAIGEVAQKGITLKPFERVLCYGSYADPVLQSAIYHFKYRFVQELHIPLGELLIHTLTQGGIETLIKKGDFAFTYIPLAPIKERWRGFNQSQLLAEYVANYFGVPTASLLKRVWLTPSQASLKKEEWRKENIKNAFTLAGLKETPQRVVVIDDVYTSGSTLKEAARTLKRAGIKTLWAATVAGK